MLIFNVCYLMFQTQSSLIKAFALKLNISIILVSPTNHKSLQAEHGIKSLSGLLVKHLSEQWN